MQGRLQGCKVDESATSREPECLRRAAVKVCAALWPALQLKKGEGEDRVSFA